jgi:sporulation protein YlmC with PRC-barrel domain
MHVSDRAGGDVGEVKEIVLDSSHQKIGCVLISADRALDLGDRYLAVPWTALDVQNRPDSDKCHFVISMDRDQLKMAPSIDKDAWSDLDSAAFNDSVKQFYRTTGMESIHDSDIMKTPSDTDIQRQMPSDRDIQRGVPSDSDIQREADKARDLTRGTLPSEELNRGLYAGDYAGSADRATGDLDVTRRDTAASFENRKLSKIVGMGLEQNNEKIGEIKDVVIDDSNGSLLYAICSFSRSVEGASGKWAALPWTILSPSADAKSFAVNADRESLKAVAYDKDSLPMLSDRTFASNINDRFNVSGGVYGFVGPGAARPEAAVSKASGVVDAIDVVDEGGFNDILHLKIKADDGTFFWVYGGPKSHVSQQGLTINKGDRIDVSGSKTVIDGRSVFLAHDLTMGGKVVQLRDANGAPLWMGHGLKEGTMDRGMKDTDMGTTPAAPAPSTPTERRY